MNNIHKTAIVSKNAIVGENVTIGAYSVIGDNVKIQNNVSIYEGVELEDYVFCGPSMVFTNIKNPRSEFPQKNFLKTREKLDEQHVEKVGEGLIAMMPWISCLLYTYDSYDE